MNFKELNSIIQQWLDSDEFIDSIVSIQGEFGLPSSAPLINTVFDLVLKNIRPEEFKDRLLSLLPQNQKNEAIVQKLVNSSLLPIKAPLTESGTDISVITPLDETSAVPFVPTPIAAPAEIPTEPEPIAPNLEEAPEPAALAPILSESTAPFVIHEENLPKQVSAEMREQEPLRPMFYSGEPGTQKKAPIASLEFGRQEKTKVNPENVLNLKDLPL
ncbi:MAG: hypothetical protein WC519_00945 [Parcubacteria group bacterium]